jgi:hypothetical protein
MRLLKSGINRFRKGTVAECPDRSLVDPGSSLALGRESGDLEALAGRMQGTGLEEYPDRAEFIDAVESVRTGLEKDDGLEADGPPGACMSEDFR